MSRRSGCAVVFSLLLLLVLQVPSTFAATRGPRLTASPLLLECLFPKVKILQEVDSDVGGLHVNIELVGTFNGQGQYCGKMKALAAVFLAEAGANAAGVLFVRLEDCQGNILDANSRIVPKGGGDVNTQRKQTTCGRAITTFQGLDNTISVQTGDVSG